MWVLTVRMLFYSQTLQKEGERLRTCMNIPTQQSRKYSLVPQKSQHSWVNNGEVPFSCSFRKYTCRCSVSFGVHWSWATFASEIEPCTVLLSQPIPCEFGNVIWESVGMQESNSTVMSTSDITLAAIIRCRSPLELQMSWCYQISTKIYQVCLK